MSNRVFCFNPGTSRRCNLHNTIRGYTQLAWPPSDNVCSCKVMQCQKLKDIFTGPTYKMFLSFTVISYVSNKPTLTKYCLTQWISKLPWELLKSAEQDSTCYIHGSGEHGKQNCLQDRANFHRCRPWKTVRIFSSSPPSAAYMCQWTMSALDQIMAFRLFGAKPLSKPMLVCCRLDP